MQQTTHTFTSTSGATSLSYLLALPKSYRQDGTRRWPLVIFLHGRGERGSDLNVLKKYGIAKMVEAASDFPFIAVSPQCPAEGDWEKLTAVLGELLDDLLTNYAIDPRRVCLTGLSMGSRGGWRWAVKQPNRFAALALICGRIPDQADFFERLPLLKHTPIWVFHGGKDPVVPIENSEKIVAALQAVDGDVRFTVYPEADHDSWTEAYATPELIPWLLQYSLPD